MAAPFPEAQIGKEVNPKINGFPIFFETKRLDKVVTANPWSFLSNFANEKCAKNSRALAVSFIEQANEFYEASKNPNASTKPLLLYYSFLNLIKAGVLIRGVEIPIAVKHGISDPRVNIKERLYFKNQTIRTQGKARDNSEIFPEFCNLFDGASLLSREIKVIDLLRYVPSIHRTYVSVTKTVPIFLPISKVLIKKTSDKRLFSHILIKKNDTEFKDLFPQFVRSSKLLSRVNLKDSGDFVVLESAPIEIPAKNPIKQYSELSSQLRQEGVFPILTSQGYRYYFCGLPEKHSLLPVLYAIMFYLGSITRYRPSDYKKIIDGRNSWIVDEFISTTPIQFIYSFCSYLVGVEVVRPYAALE